MSADEFTQIFEVVAFLIIVWISGRLCKFIKLSPLIGWIASGMIFGPKCVKLINENHENVWKLLGTLGVTLMIAESGTHIHFDKIKKVGLTAVSVALIGTFLPLALGFGLGMFNHSINLLIIELTSTHSNSLSLSIARF